MSCIHKEACMWAESQRSWALLLHPSSPFGNRWYGKWSHDILQKAGIMPCFEVGLYTHTPPPCPGYAAVWLSLSSAQPSNASGVPGPAVAMLPSHHPPSTWSSPNFSVHVQTTWLIWLILISVPCPYIVLFLFLLAPFCHSLHVSVQCVTAILFFTLKKTPQNYLQSTRRPTSPKAMAVFQPWYQPSLPSYNSLMPRLLELGFSPHMQHSP